MSAGAGALPDLQHRTRYLVLIDGGGSMVALLFDDARRQLVEIDGSSEEVAVMTRGLRPQQGAQGAEWDAALRGHNPRERAAAQVYTLDI